MKLVTGNMSDFIEETIDRRVCLFGASMNIQKMLYEYYQTGLALRIDYIIDNDKQKQNEMYNTTFGSWKVFPVDQLIKDYSENNNLVVLVMVDECHQIIEQLRNLHQLKDLEVYIYGLFPFYERSIHLPHELVKIRTGKQKIPKIINYIWFGKETFPDNYKKNIEGWKKFCPDYEIKLWNENNYDINKIPYVRDAYNSGMYAFASDCARLDIVNMYGGIYFDTDVEMLKNIDELLFSESFFSVSYNSIFNSGDGFGAIAGHKIIGDMLEVYNNIKFANTGSNTNANGWKESIVLAKLFGGKIECKKISIFKEAIIYPVEFFSGYSTIYGVPVISSNAYTLHRHETLWMNKHTRSGRAECKAYISKIFEIGEKKVYELN